MVLILVIAFAISESNLVGADDIDSTMQTTDSMLNDIETTTDSELPETTDSKEKINTIDVQQTSTIEESLIETNETSSIDVKPIARGRSVSALNMFEIDSETTLIEFLESPINVNGKLTKDITLNHSATVRSNKHLDLNGKIIRAGDGSKRDPLGQIHLTGTSMTEFSIKNGEILGGDTRGLGKQAVSIGFISVDDETGWMLMVNVRDITHTSQGGFFKGNTSNIVFDGDVTLNNNQFNVRALNMEFNGIFNGTTSAKGNPELHSKLDGGLNLSFNDDKAYGSTKDKRRVLNITSTAQVKLINTNEGSNYYANNIAGFSQVNVSGSLDAEAISPNIRTMVSSSSTTTWLPNSRTEVNVHQGSVFKLHNKSSSNYGVIYTYNTTLTIDNPKEYDLKSANNMIMKSNDYNSNIYFHNTNIAVWNHLSDVPPLDGNFWTDVQNLSIEGFRSNNGKVTSSDLEVEAHFTTNSFQSYNRISNNFKTPHLIPDISYKDLTAETYVLPNNATLFFGTALYKQPNDPYMNDPINSKQVSLSIGRQSIPSVMTTMIGEWQFNNLNLEQVKGGTKGEVLMNGFTNQTSKVEVTIIDKLPPKVTPKVIKVPVGDTMTLNDPKRGLSSYSDETTSKDKLKIDMITGKDERDKMVEKPGVYQADIRVTDEAGNATIVTSDVVVYQGDNPVTTHFVVGEDMTYDYREWMGLEERDRQKKVLEIGRVKGYNISAEKVTELSSTMLNVRIPQKDWKPNDIIPVTIEVGGYAHTVRVSLDSHEVTMTIKHIYDNGSPIIGDLEKNRPLEPITIPNVEVGDDLEVVLKKANIKTSHEGYTFLGIEVDGYTEQPTSVPDKDFTVLYRYKGMTQVTPTDLDFKTITLSWDVRQLFEPSNDASQIIFVNTMKEKDVTLSVSLPNGMTLKSGEQYKGDLLYFEGNDTPLVINHEATDLVRLKGGDAPPIATLDAKGKTENTGFKLRQSNGNYVGEYHGELLWTVGDTPRP